MPRRYFTAMTGGGCWTGALLLSGGRGGVFLDEHENGAGSVGGHFKMVTALEMRPRLGLDSWGRLSLRNLLDGRGTRPHMLATTQAGRTSER
jgi:hypothetical protein